MFMSINPFNKCFTKDQGRGVIQTFQGGEDSRDPLLVWIRPTIACLNFIKQELARLGLNSISSVGCGNGTLGET